MASTMQLEFAQAMSDFKVMFPDMDHEVIEAVLRANQGAVDATIDQLLAMSTDNQNEKLRNEMDAKSPQCKDLITLSDEPKTATDSAHSHMSAAAAAGNAVLLSLGSSGSASASPHHQHTGASPKLRATTLASGKHAQLSAVNVKRSVNGSRRWNPPMLRPLPADFLRLRTPGLIGYDVTLRGSDFDLPDEQFALMLQNEEFMNQLRWNEEFMKALEKEQVGKSKTEDDAAFKERLKNMGKLSRKKFLQIARVFTWQRNKKITTAKQIDSLPLKEEPSDDEDHHHQQQQQQQQQQSQNKQMQHAQQQQQQQQQ